MFCEPYQKTLNAAALGDEHLTADVRKHLASCDSCRRSFAQEKAVFGLIEAEMQARVNADMPASLLARVRQKISASPSARTWRVPALAYFAAGLALGAMALLFAVRTKGPLIKPDRTAGAVSSPAPSEPGGLQRENGSGPMFVATRKRSHKPRQVVLDAEPDVLVPAQEQLGLQRYAASLRSKAADRAANVKPEAQLEIKHLEIASIDLKGLSIDPLQSGDSD